LASGLKFTVPPMAIFSRVGMIRPSVMVFKGQRAAVQGEGLGRIDQD